MRPWSAPVRPTLDCSGRKEGDWPYRIETLAAQRNRKRFCCSVEPLDRYFREQVTQDIRRRVTTCYVAVTEETNDVAGYYSLAAGSIPLVELPDVLARRLR